MPFGRGTVACWRSIDDGIVRTARPMIVARDDPDLIALYLPIGTTYVRRTGQRGGPRGRQMVTWDGGYEERSWSRHRVLMLHRPGRAHTVQLFWDDRDVLGSWYVNPELPWSRSAIGFDTLDHVLDVVIAADRRSWELKDDDELTWATEQGRFTAAQAAGIRAEAAGARDEVLAATPPWTSDWEDWRPDPAWPLPTLPASWADA